MGMIEAIAAKRDGRRNSPQELEFIALGSANGSIPDYQISAWLMAVYLNGLEPQETADLTLAMAHSGERLDLRGLPKPWLDKHSTGGVGDKTTLVVLPILAACGVTMIKMSGRGLGVTGGTIDKLESIPGFRTDLTPEEMLSQAKSIGIALSGQTPRLAPADKALYALRDVTGTVASIPLITASILSKKIAGGAETIVLDVKCGGGAFMKTMQEAEALARSLVDTGKLAGLNISTLITDMDQPLGRAVGNLLEVEEAYWALKRRWIPDDMPSMEEAGCSRARFVKLCFELATHALEVCQAGDKNSVREAVASGRAFDKFLEWVSAQGGHLDSMDKLRQPSELRFDWVLNSGGRGYISKIDAQAVGEVLLDLGGGRREKDDMIDPLVGVDVHCIVGQEVQEGQPLFGVHARSQEEADRAARKLQDCFVLSAEKVETSDPVLKIVS